MREAEHIAQGVGCWPSAEPYRYGLHDCSTFAREAVIAVTDVTPPADVELPRGRMARAPAAALRGPAMASSGQI